MYTVANVIKRAGGADTEKLIAAMKGMEMDTPIGPIVWRPIDNQSTMGAYVGQLAKKKGVGAMVNWRFADGANFLPPFEEVRAMRKD
jgi:branched-chain amino acid transport system substrate-binding protein